MRCIGAAGGQNCGVAVGEDGRFFEVAAMGRIILLCLCPAHSDYSEYDGVRVEEPSGEVEITYDEALVRWVMER